MNLKDRYKDYSPKVQEYMNSVINDLTNDYGDNWPSSWLISLDILADHLVLYLEAIKHIKENGTSHINREGRQVKNPNITVLSNAMAEIRDVTKSFCFNPLQRSKIKALESADADSIKDNYIASLTD